MIGGARDPGCLDESDAQLAERALGALRRLLDLRADPEMIFVVRHARGIPQYPVGHVQTLAQITTGLARYPGLHLTGNSYRGIAMNACIKEAEALAPDHPTIYNYMGKAFIKVQDFSSARAGLNAATNPA